MSAWRRTLDELKHEANHRTVSGSISGAYRVVRNWEFLMSRFWNAEKSSYYWHLSAMLYPKGRSSIKTDWHFVGEAAGYLGAPEKPVFGFPIDANAPIYWSWPDRTV